MQTRKNENSIWGDRPTGTEDWEGFNRTIESLKTLGAESVRLSVGMSQIMPREGEIDEEVLEKYKDMLGKVRDAGAKNVILTLHHFDEPKWFDEKGGWENYDNLEYFEQYTEACVKKLGEDVDVWIPINEPNIYVSEGYVTGNWAPYDKIKGPTDFSGIKKAWTVYDHLAEAHIIAARTIKDHNPDAKIACAVQMSDVRAGEGRFARPAAIVGGKIYQELSCYRFIDKVKDADALDIIGVQSYMPFYIGKPKLSETTDMGWPYDPTGDYLENVLVNTSKKYPGMPILITENGIADAEDFDSVRDGSKRIKFIKASMRGIKRACDRGANVIGYYHWSIEDNYEMAMDGELVDKGRFGLFRKDHDTLEREIATGGRYYKKIIGWAKQLRSQEESREKETQAST